MKSRATTIGVSSLLVLGLAGCSSGEAGSSAGAGATAIASAAVPQGGYAGKLPVPDEKPADPAAQLLVMAVQNAVVPSASDVGIPACPGARILSTMAAGQMGEGSLPALAMLCSDDVSAVFEFYQEKLAGWDHEEIIGNHMFWNGPEGSNPMDITGTFPVVSVVALDDGGTETSIWPDVKTRVDIRYTGGQ